MIKTVLFDYGGVLSEGGKQGAIAQAIAETYGVPVARVEALDLAELVSHLLRGEAGAQVYFTELDRLLQAEPANWRQRQAKYIQVATIFRQSKPVCRLAERLRHQGITTGIFSNISDFLALELERRGFYKNFDPLILSCREHMEKAGDDFYQLAVQRCQLPAEQILVIDDQDRWQPAVEHAGMQFLHATSPEQIVRDATRLIEGQNGIKL